MKENSFYKIRRIITHSPLHRPLMEWRAKIDAFRIKRMRIDKRAETIYVVSPYKTGTTYISSLWNEQISKHEPFQLYSLRDMQRNFKMNFLKREAVLNLKIECSGFLSLFLKKLPKSQGQYRYIYILRPPTKWVSSVIQHFAGLSSIGFNYINEFYWKPLLTYDMVSIIHSSNKEDLLKLVTDLYNVYFKFLRESLDNEDIWYVELNKADNFVLRLGQMIGTKPNFANSWKRESKNKINICIPVNTEMDDKYYQFINAIDKKRFFPLGD